MSKLAHSNDATMQQIERLAREREGEIMSDMQWMPISTAPRDGKAILLAARPSEDDAMVVVGWWDNGLESWAWGQRRRLHTEPSVWCELPDLKAIPAAVEALS